MALLSKREFEEFREREGDKEPVVVGQQYWTIARRFHIHRATNPMIRPVAVRDMLKLRPTVSSDAVRARIGHFIQRNQKDSPGNDGGGSGPLVA